MRHTVDMTDRVAHLGTLLILKGIMRLTFVGITPDTPDNGCPAVYVDEDTGDIWIQGPAVTDSTALEEVARHSPIGLGEAVVKVPPVMKSFVMEAVNGTYERGRHGPGPHPRRS
jgi:hypothetical protein